MYSFKPACSSVRKLVSMPCTGKGRCVGVTRSHFMERGHLLCVHKYHKRKDLPCCVAFYIYPGRPGVHKYQAV